MGNCLQGKKSSQGTENNGTAERKKQEQGHQMNTIHSEPVNMDTPNHMSRNNNNGMSDFRK